MVKVVFKKLSRKDNLDIIKWTLFDNDDTLNLRENTLEMFPELKDINVSDKDSQETNLKIEEIFDKYYSELEDKIDEDVLRYDEIWKEYNDKYFETLCKYLNVSLDDKTSIIEAMIGYIPVSPRYLENYSFYTTIYLEEKNLLEIVCHELLHFAWFIKWKELYPDSKLEDLECPSLVWEFSEIIVDAILNSAEMKKCIELDGRAYDMFYDLEYNGENVMSKLRDIFNSNDSIENRIREGFEYFKKVRGVK